MLEYVNHPLCLCHPFCIFRDVWIRTQSFGNVVGKKANSGPKLVIHVPYLYRTGLQTIVFKVTDWDKSDLDSYMHFTGLPILLFLVLTNSHYKLQTRNYTHQSVMRIFRTGLLLSLDEKRFQLFAVGLRIFFNFIQFRIVAKSQFIFLTR